MKKLILLILLIAQVIAGHGQSSDQNVKISTQTGDLHGVLSIADTSQTTPVVIIVPGSGATDRDGNQGFILHTNAYKQLAVQLAKNGISTLRFDKRGVGQSQKAVLSESDLRFETYINDLLAWIQFAKETKHFNAIHIIGHSEGALIGMVASQKSGVDKYISLAGPGVKIDETIKQQVKGQFSDELYKEVEANFDTLAMGQTLHSVNPFLMQLFRPSLQPYMMSWMKYDPCHEISKLEIPILIIQGTTDIQVSEDNAQLLHKAAPTSQLSLIENMNHVLKEAPMDRQANMPLIAMEHCQ
ncbi:alpha/beta hydrolase [Carboxylicivirga marina]|uniref:Alpha/beta fold hydrolase n=1 Tax=Carboxylicivirga marina TaxID=2800988 RepID=A0ABS1HMW3_9BACT|nr:alpha/beta fold hydrolase [Carboxylicivirga marina]MBK3518971.1 alpha/beta fold hydrolase [Carboxylicivirga marina]